MPLSRYLSSRLPGVHRGLLSHPHQRPTTSRPCTQPTPPPASPTQLQPPQSLNSQHDAPRPRCLHLTLRRSRPSSRQNPASALQFLLLLHPLQTHDLQSHPSRTPAQPRSALGYHLAEHHPFSTASLMKTSFTPSASASISCPLQSHPHDAAAAKPHPQTTSSPAPNSRGSPSPNVTTPSSSSLIPTCSSVAFIVTWNHDLYKGNESDQTYSTSLKISNSSSMWP